MNLFKSFKDKKKPGSDIIASVEEEDILYEEQALAQNQEQPKIEEPVAPAPVEEPVQEPVQENEPAVEEPAEEVVEETVEEPAEEVTEEAEEVVEEPAEEVEESVEEETTEEPVEEVVEEPIEEVAEEEPAEEPVEEVAEEVVEEPAEEVEETADEPVEEIAQEETEEAVEETAEVVEEVQEVEEPAEVVEETAEVEPIVIPEVEVEEASEVPKEPVYQPTFAEKMNIADEDIQRRYDELKNYALRFKKLTWRISKKYDSINQGRFQFVKLSVAGKTLKLNLNMDIAQCDPKYHCVDKRATKTYEEVPTQMRIKSDRGLKYARELIDQCAEIHGLIENPKFKPVDSLELIRQHLELGNTDDIIIETQFDDDEE